MFSIRYIRYNLVDTWRIWFISSSRNLNIITILCCLNRKVKILFGFNFLNHSHYCKLWDYIIIGFLLSLCYNYLYRRLKWKTFILKQIIFFYLFNQSLNFENITILLHLFYNNVQQKTDMLLQLHWKTVTYFEEILLKLGVLST